MTQWYDPEVPWLIRMRVPVAWIVIMTVMVLMMFGVAEVLGWGWYLLMGSSR
jgi:uncharacterized membrane protein